MCIRDRDKQAFKALLTYFFAKLEEVNGKDIDWEYMVYGSLFSLLKNIVLSDIKAPVIKKIKNDYPQEYVNINRWVVNQWKGVIDDIDLLSKFEEFLLEKDDDGNINYRIIRAAHKYSSYREFEILKSTSTAN